MVASPDRKNGLSQCARSWRSCHVLFSRCRRNHEDLLLVPAREGPTALRGRRSRQARAWRGRLHRHLTRLRPENHPSGPSRSPGPARRPPRTLSKKRGGRTCLLDTRPELDTNFQKILQNHTAGDPVKPGVLWTNLSLEELARRMADLGTPVCPKTIKQFLDLHDMGHRQAFKYVSMGENKDRNAQFENIAGLKQSFLASPNPIISMDTKKRELLGLFYRDGKLYIQETLRVYDHDFPSFGCGVVIPHGLYDLKRNLGPQSRHQPRHQRVRLRQPLSVVAGGRSAGLSPCQITVAPVRWRRAVSFQARPAKGGGPDAFGNPRRPLSALYFQVQSHRPPPLRARKPRLPG